MEILNQFDDDVTEINISCKEIKGALNFRNNLITNYDEIKEKYDKKIDEILI